MQPTQTFKLGIKKPEPEPVEDSTPIPTATVNPAPTPAGKPAPGPRPNPLNPRSNPLAPRANPLAPKPAIPSKPTAPVAAPKPTPTPSSTSVKANPLSPKPARANPLSPQPARANPLSPKQRANPLNRNNPTTEPAEKTQSEKTSFKPITPVGPPRVNVSTGVFDNVKIEPASEPAVENDGIDTSARESVANVRKMFEVNIK